MEEEVDSLAHFVVQSYRSSDVTNVIVCTIVMSVMVFYVFSYILIGVLERRRLPKGRLHMPYGDSLDSNSHYYVVTISTGNMMGASLPRQGLVQVTLCGSITDSVPLVIRNFENDRENLLLQAGNIDRFLMPVPASIGEVKKVDIDLYSLEHESISWYVKYVRVTDVHYGTISDFLFDRSLGTCNHMRTGVHQSEMPLCRRFAERFLSIFLELHMWTTTWTKTGDNCSFRRSIRMSFFVMTLSCLMLANLLVCVIPILHIKRFGILLPNQASLIQDALIYGVIANVVVLILQYIFELLLRRVRTPVDCVLSVRGRDIWTKKPLPASLYKEIDGSDSDADAYGEYSSRPMLGKAVPKAKNGHQNKRHSRASQASTLRDINDPWDEPWSPEVTKLPSVAEDHREHNSSSQQRGQVSSYFADDETDGRKSTPVPYSDNSNMNANKEEQKIEDRSSFTNVVKSMLWDEKDGVVSKYIKQQERSSNAIQPSPKCGENHENMANYIVTLVVNEAKEAIVNESDPQIGLLQQEVFNKLEAEMGYKLDLGVLLGAVASEGMDIPHVQSHSSEGQINIQKSPDKMIRPLSVTTSCPEVLSPIGSVPDASVKFGPVAIRLSESITAMALRNSYSSLQETATNKLVSQSKERISSFTSLVQKENLSEHTSMKPSYPDIENRDSAQSMERASVKNLLESISATRAERLTDDSMRYVAKASLGSLVSNEALAKLRNTALDYSQKTVQSFTFEVVNNLYDVVRGKLDALIETNLKETEGDDSKPKKERIADFLSTADEEIRKSVLPPLEEYIQSLLVDQAKSVEEIDLDLIMTAFSGQYVDTIVTNAVLQTHVGILKARKSLERLGTEEKYTDSNDNNNKQGTAIREALAQLEVKRSTEVENIIEQLCDYMLKLYQSKKCCIAEHSQEVNDAVKNTFRRSAQSLEVFDCIMSEASEYLRLLSEHCDMAAMQENRQLMSRLSDSFLVSGLDIDIHTTLTEELSSKLLDQALDSAFAVVAEHLIKPFLHPGQKFSQFQQAAVPESSIESKPKSILKFGPAEEAGSASASPQKTNLQISPTVPYPGSPKKQTLWQQAIEDVSTVEECYKSTTPRLETESDGWTTASPGSPKQQDVSSLQNKSFGSSPRSPNVSPLAGRLRSPGSSSRKSPNRRKLIDSLLDKGAPPTPDFDSPDGFTGDRSYVESPQRFSPYSPMRSSTPRSETSENNDIPVQWSPMRGSSEAKPLYKKTSSDVISGTGAIYGGSSGTSTVSIPLLPKNSQTLLSNDQDLHEVLRSKSPGHLYTPAPDSTTTLDQASLERERIWQLNIEREIMGEPMKCLPTCCMHGLQVLMVMITVSALSLCLLFGLHLPNESAIAWVVALSSAVFQHAFFWEVLKVVAVSFYYVSCFDIEI